MKEYHVNLNAKLERMKFYYLLAVALSRGSTILAIILKQILLKTSKELNFWKQSAVNMDYNATIESFRHVHTMHLRPSSQLHSIYLIHGSNLTPKDSIQVFC